MRCLPDGRARCLCLFLPPGALPRFRDIVPKFEKNLDAPAPLARYHQVLLAVSGAVGGLTLGELGRRTGLPRSSAHRLATALCAVGYLEIDEAKGTYGFGPALRQLIRRSLTADNRLRAFRPALEHLVGLVGETAFFARLRDDGEVELVKALTPADGQRSFIFPGTGPRPLDKCSSSKAILAFADARQIEERYGSGGWPGLPESTNSFQAFMAELQKVQREGFAVCDGEIDEGVYSLAVPVPVGPLLGLYSIGVVGPAQRMKAFSTEKLVASVRAAAEIATRNLEDGAPTQPE